MPEALGLITESEVRILAEQHAKANFRFPTETDIKIIMSAILMGINIGLEQAQKVYSDVLPKQPKNKFGQTPSFVVSEEEFQRACDNLKLERKYDNDEENSSEPVEDSGEPDRIEDET